MARRKNAFPELRWHSPSNQWCIYHGNKRIRFGSDRQKAERQRLELIAKLQGESYTLPPDGVSITLAEALELYKHHLESNGADRRKLARLKAVAGVAVRSHGHFKVSAFRGPALKEVRAILVTKKNKRGEPLTRRYVGHLIDALVLAFRWFVSNDYAPTENLVRLREMSAELTESPGGRASPVVAAVDDAIVEKTLPHMPRDLAAMVQVQRATGMRPGEVCAMRREELSTRPDEFVPVAGMTKRVSAIAFDGELVWLYCPTRHKNLHRGKPRVVPLGKEAQEALSPVVRTGHLFLAESGKPYTTITYGQAVARAAHRAKVPRWSPIQLRKAAAMRIDAAFGADGADKAAAMLGHAASRRALDSYLAQQIEKAVEAAARAG